MTEEDVTPDTTTDFPWKPAARNAAAGTGFALGAVLAYGVAANATFVRTLAGDVSLSIAGALTHALVAGIGAALLLVAVPKRRVPRSPDPAAPRPCPCRGRMPP